MSCLLTISGVVTPYSGQGRKLGYPTANIPCPEDTPEGVFVGYTHLNGKKLPSFIFVGAPETIGETLKRAETHIFDFSDKDLYGETITIEVVKKLRNNQKFDSVDKLLEQMHLDETHARNFFI